MKTLLAALLTLALAQAHAALRDPFARPHPASKEAAATPAAPKEEARLPHLRAILFTHGHALADIDGQVLAEGQWFGAWRVARIEERRVTLSRAGEAALVLVLDREKES